MNSPKVSICIPTYNHAQFIGEAVESALQQTFPDMEVVVSVNHCTDNTEEVLQRYSDPRLRIVRPPAFLGMFDHFNFCVSQSRGKYFSFVGSDDILLPTFVEEHVKVLEEHPEVVFSHAATEVIDEHGGRILLERSINRSFVRPGIDELRRYLYGPKCVASSAMIRRDAFDTVGGFSPYHMVGDWDLWLRLLQVGSVAYNEQVLFKWRDWDYDTGERSKRRIVMWRETIDLYRKHEPQILAKYPWLEKDLRAAKRKQALVMAGWYANEKEPQTKEEVRRTVLAFCTSRRVRAKVALGDLGFGPAYIAINKTKALFKNSVKALLRAYIPA